MLISDFPFARLRRLRSSQWVRDLLAETHLNSKDLIYPLFIKSGYNIKEEISMMPGVFRYSVDEVLPVIQHALNLGIKVFAPFPCVDSNLKSIDGKEAFNPNNLLCNAIKKIKDKFGNSIGIISDVALDPYTSHGHDGIFKNGKILNDITIEALCKQALVQSAAGCDIIAPSDMMDGRIKNIRQALDSSQFEDVMILSYSAKYCSSLYTPFRDAISTNNLTIDKSSYQLDYRNSKEAMLEIAHDIKESADIIMIKPAMMYADIIKEASSRFDNPIFAYQVSGEYAMLCGNINNMLESLFALKRSGSTAIFTYAATQVAEIINY